MSSALFVPSNRSPAALEVLAPAGKHLTAVSALTRRARAFVYALPRTPKSYAFLFVADETSAMEEIVTRFTGLTSLTEGAIVELPREVAAPIGR